MPLVVADRVRETTTTTGTGTITLAGAVTGYQSFGAIGNGNTTYYTINAGSQWEVGIGTYLGAGPTLSRDTVLESSNSGSLVSFSAGTKDVFVTYPAEKSISDGYGLLPIANGGTGAITAGAALTALGAYPASNPNGYTSNVGTVTSVSGTGTVSGLTLTGTVTTTGSLTLGGTLSLTSGQVTTALGFTPYNDTNPSGYLSTVSLTTNVTGTLPIANGGTGATTAANALTSLGAYPASNPNGYTSNTGTVTGVTGTAPIVSSGGTAPAISISAATTVAAGSMSATDKTKLDGIATNANNYVLPKATATSLGGVEVFDATVQTVAANAVTTTASRTYGIQLNAADQMVVNVPWVDTNSGGTVTSVSGTGTVSGLSLSGTVTTTGSLTLGGTLAVTASNFASQTANTFLAAPNGAAGVPTFRAVVAADIPTLNQNTTGTAANVTGTVAIANGGTGATTAATALTSLGAYPATNPAGYTTNVGTVTSVGGTGTVNGITLTGTVTSSGSLTLGGTLSGVSLTTQVSGTLPVANGGTGATTLTGVVIGNGTSAFTVKTNPTGDFVGTTDTQTLTNKRMTPRVSSTASITSPLAWNSDNFDQYAATAQSTAFTISADAGTPTDGQKMVFRFQDNGTPRVITFTGGVAKGFQPVGVTLTVSGSNFTYTTVAGKLAYFGCIYSAADSRWDIIALSKEA